MSSLVTFRDESAVSFRGLGIQGSSVRLLGEARMKVHIYKQNWERLKLAFLVKLRADPDADFDEFAERVVNCLLKEMSATELLRKAKMCCHHDMQLRR